MVRRNNSLMPCPTKPIGPSYHRLAFAFSGRVGKLGFGGLIPGMNEGRALAPSSDEIGIAACLLSPHPGPDPASSRQGRSAPPNRHLREGGGWLFAIVL